MRTEETLLAAIIQNPDFLVKVVRSGLKPSHLSSRSFNLIYETLYEFAGKEYTSEQAKEAVSVRIDIEKGERAIAIRHVDSLSSKDIKGFDFSLDILKKKLKT